MYRSWNITATLLTLIALLSACNSSRAVPRYDVVISGGRVMDPETNFDEKRYVGIRDGVIVAITEDSIAGTEAIDATGLVVTAGFIDTHHHGAGNSWGIKASLRDGVTTPLDLEFGAINVAGWYAERKGKWVTNYGAAASHELHRARVLDGMALAEPADGDDFAQTRAASYEENGQPDWSVTQPSPQQLNDILKNLDGELRDGALGIVSTTAYMAKGATTFEMFNVQKTAARYGRLFGSHVRHLGNMHTPTEGTLGAFELIANGVALKQPILVSHNNNFGWWEVEEHLQALRDQGYNMWSEYYPYTCGSANIGTEFIKPDQIGELNVDYTNLMDPRTGEFKNREWYDQVVAEDPGYLIVLCMPAREEWLPKWLEVPHMTVAGDQMPPVDANGRQLSWDDPFEVFSGHPRTVGTHAKTLRLAREHKVPLMQVLAQNSYWAAKHLGEAGIEAMQVRGRMQEGMVADIVVFDPETVTDNATYVLGENGLPSTGIPFVLVNGMVVVRDSNVVDDVYPGQSVRYPVEAEGRFEAVPDKPYDTALGNPAYK